ITSFGGVRWLIPPPSHEIAWDCPRTGVIRPRVKISRVSGFRNAIDTDDPPLACLDLNVTRKGAAKRHKRHKSKIFSGDNGNTWRASATSYFGYANTFEGETHVSHSRPNCSRYSRHDISVRIRQLKRSRIARGMQQHQRSGRKQADVPRLREGRTDLQMEPHHSEVGPA